MDTLTEYELFPIVRESLTYSSIIFLVQNFSDFTS